MTRRHSESAEAEPICGLRWVSGADTVDHTGYHVLSFSEVRGLVASTGGAQRQTTDIPSRALNELFEKHERVAVTAVPTLRNGDLRDLYGYVVEPAWRRQVDLLIEADRPFSEIVGDDVVEFEFGYAWTLQRLQYVMARYHRFAVAGLPPMTPIEQQLYEAMRAAELAPRLQYGIGKFRVDFAFPELLLAVEADGRAWHDAERDARRDARLRALGWEIVRFSGSEIYRDAASCAAGVAASCLQRQREIQRTIVAEPANSGAQQIWWRRLVDWFRGMFSRRSSSEPEPLVPTEAQETEAPPAPWLDGLDPSQRAAVRGHDGVVQVIAPAGSGKTRVIVARVQELRSRGAAANRILCTTFNTAAAEELRNRLAQVDEQQAEVRSFSALGRKILEEANLLRRTIQTTTYGEWRFLAQQAMKATDDGVWIEASDAKNVVSEYKLGQMIPPAEVALALPNNATALARTQATLYRLHEELLERRDRLDFDDLIYRAVDLLRTNATVRAQWQKRFDYVLVDEYQDIEQAQERLIQIIAAPEDGLFCVGDEDQCIYAWRRASVYRIVNLDELYPGLQRYSLAVNYRSDSRIVAASRALIEHNQHRFDKPIESAPEARRGEVTVVSAASLEAQLSEVGRLAEHESRGELVMLARTTNLLRQAAIALARRGISIDAPERVTSQTGVNGVLVAYLELLTNPRQARAADISTTFRVPNRYLPDQAAETVAVRLRAGKSFAESLQGAERGEPWRSKRLTEAADLFDRLTTIEAADEFVHLLRSEGGLDRHYSEQQKLSAHDQSKVDQLEAAELRARGMTVAEFADALNHETQLITAHLDPKQGIELRTIHGSKGREWGTVILIGTDEGELPHFRSLNGAASQDDALEDERRLAYVAMTRAKHTLTLMCIQGNESRFVSEAALSPVALKLERDHTAAASPVLVAD